MTVQHIIPLPTPATAGDALDVLEEVEAMERELGHWLRRRGHHLMARAPAGLGRRRTGSGLHPSLWRTLIVVWCTSPGVRDRYSGDLRAGLLCAVESMDDATAAALVRDLLTGPPTGGGAAMAA